MKLLHHVEQGYLTQAEAGQQMQVSARQVRPGLRGAWVELERRLDDTLWVRCRGSDLSLRPSLPPSKTRNQNANTFPLPTTLGEGHFYPAKKRTFLLCVDR